MSKVQACPLSGKITALSILGASDEPPDPPGCSPPPSDPPPGDNTPVGPQSHLLLRDDGAVLVSLEEANDRDLSDREIIRCVLLQGDELAQARAAAANGFAAGVAVVLGALPWTKP